MENKQEIMDFKHDLPIDTTFVPFTQYSHFPNNISDQKQQKNTKLIVGGAVVSDGDGFYKFQVNDNGNSINYKLFKNECNKKFANLKHAGIHTAQCTHSYLVQNNKYLVVLQSNKHYNVYDMENDKWLLKQREKELKHSLSRSALINDEIIIISQGNELQFYFIGDHHITDPILMHKYTLKTKDISFMFHGMCIIDFIKQTSPKNELYKTYKLKIILFGGSANKNFLSSFLYLNILLSYKDFSFVNLSIDENLIGRNKIKLTNMNWNQAKENGWFCFGFECILNDKNEPLIIIIGHDGESMSKNIHLFNCVTHELTRHEKVN